MITEEKKVYNIDGYFVVGDSLYDAIEVFMDFMGEKYDDHAYEINNIQLLTSYRDGISDSTVISKKSRALPQYLCCVVNKHNNAICGGLYEDEKDAQKLRDELCEEVHNPNAYVIKMLLVSWKQ